MPYASARSEIIVLNGIRLARYLEMVADKIDTSSCSFLHILMSPLPNQNAFIDIPFQGTLSVGGMCWY
jgi:hypothetical protein